MYVFQTINEHNCIKHLKYLKDSNSKTYNFVYGYALSIVFRFWMKQNIIPTIIKIQCASSLEFSPRNYQFYSSIEHIIKREITPKGCKKTSTKHPISTISIWIFATERMRSIKSRFISLHFIAVYLDNRRRRTRVLWRQWQQKHSEPYKRFVRIGCGNAKKKKNNNNKQIIRSRSAIKDNENQ